MTAAPMLSTNRLHLPATRNLNLHARFFAETTGSGYVRGFSPSGGAA